MEHAPPSLEPKVKIFPIMIDALSSGVDHVVETQSPTKIIQDVLSDLEPKGVEPIVIKVGGGGNNDSCCD